MEIAKSALNDDDIEKDSRSGFVYNLHLLLHVVPRGAIPMTMISYFH